jgi:hypothetical protein
VGKTKKSRGLTVKPGVNCKDLRRWKGCFVIFKTAGGFVQNGIGKILLTTTVNFDQQRVRILAVDPLKDGWRGRGPRLLTWSTGPRWTGYKT